MCNSLTKFFTFKCDFLTAQSLWDPTSTKWTDGQKERGIDVGMDGWLDGWMDVWMDGGWTDG